jgi:uncharacterized membrane protein YfcA
VQIYLPIAELPVNIFVILAIGLAVGFISGMFGVGGGFLTTPLLIFVGISPAVAAATVTCHIAGTTFSAAFAYWRRRTRPALARCFLLSAAAWSAPPAACGCSTSCARSDNSISPIGLSCVVLLGVVRTLMVVESARAISRARHGRPTELRRPGSHAWFRLPLKFRFKRSRSTARSFGSGHRVRGQFVSTFIGIGGGFLVVPALIYIMRVPTSVVIGTSLILTLVTMALAIVMHAATNHLVDAVLAMILIIGGVIGAQFGARTGQKTRGEHLRLLLGLLVIAVGIRFASIWCWDRRPLCCAIDGDSAMTRLAAILLAIAALSAASHLRRRGGDRVALKPSRDGDVELHRNGTGPVRRDRNADARRAADIVATIVGPRQNAVTFPRIACSASG